MSPRPRPRRHALVAILTLALCAAATRAAAPVVEHLYPAGGQQGTTVAVTVGGKFERWPVRFWADHPELNAEPSPDEGKLSIKVGPSVPPGPHLVRLYDAEGPSSPFVFVVGTRTETIEAEPNDEVARAQEVAALPVTLNGRLEKSGDVDSYAVRLEAGQCLSAAVQGRRLGAPMDPLLHLYDPAGNPLAFVHDGLGLDPLLVYRADSAGTYVVRVSGFKHPPAADVKLAGEPADVYRLTLSAGLPLRYAMPAGVRRGSKAAVRTFDWDGNETGTREVDAAGAPATEDELPLPPADGDAAPSVALGNGPEWTEPEVRPAAPLSSPAAVTGRLERPGEEDGFAFAAKKGDRLVAFLRAAAVASPMDAVLRIEDEAGKQLASNDDERGKTGDARLEWTAPADGVFRAVVADLFGRGGHEYVYRLSLQPPAPGVVATADADAYRVAPGKSAAIKLTVSRTGGYAAPLVAVAVGLPPGVTAAAVEVPEKGGEVTLSLTASPDAKPATGPVRVVLLSTDPTQPAAWPASCSLRKDPAQELIARTTALWLTVPPP